MGMELVKLETLSVGTFLRGYEIGWNWKLGQGVRLFGWVRFELIAESDREYGSFARYVYLAQNH